MIFYIFQFFNGKYNDIFHDINGKIMIRKDICDEHHYYKNK